jgi:hypothetical protein
MADTIIPKAENADKGFHYTVSDEQLAEYAKWTTEEKLNWLEQTWKFIDSVQTQQERERMKNVRND